MSKLEFDYLTLDEAAEWLSRTLTEPGITRVQVLRLVLSGRLTLSVYFPNGAYARAGRLVRHGEAPQQSGHSIALDGGDVLLLDDEVRMLHDRGLYDLPMVGAERLHVERLYEKESGGPAVKLTPIYGAFITRGEQWFELQESWAQRVAAGRASGFEIFLFAEAAKARWAARHGRLGVDDAVAWSTDTWLQKIIRSQSRPSCHTMRFPAGELPGDRVLVVRSEALRELHAGLTAPSASKSATTRRGNTTDWLLVGMAKAGWGWDSAALKSPEISRIASDLKNFDVPVSEDTLRDRLKEAAENVLGLPRRRGRGR